MTAFQIGDRVRTTVDVPSAFDEPANVFEAFSAPAGTLGTITGLPKGPLSGYGVLLDGDPNQLPAAYDAHKIELVWTAPCPAVWACDPHPHRHPDQPARRP